MNQTMKFIAPLLLLCLFSCKKDTLDVLQLGNWGTEHAELRVQADSWYLEFDCAHATVSEPVLIIDGAFESPAEYFQEAGVYIDDPEFHKAIPSKVSGRLLKNGNLELSIFVGPDLENYGHYTFVWNQESRVYKCA